MLQLKDVLAALQREVETGLTEERPSPNGAAWKADRVILSLRVNLEHSTVSGHPSIAFGVDQASLNGAAADGNAISLTLEFSRSPIHGTSGAMGAASMLAPPGAPPALPSLPVAETLLTRLSRLFGPPGFDNSARAMVFRELFEELSSTQVAQLKDILAGAPIDGADDTVRRARHTVIGIIRSGPLKDVPQGTELLQSLLKEYSAADLVRLIRDHWKTQHDWMDHAGGDARS